MYWACGKGPDAEAIFCGLIILHAIVRFKADILRLTQLGTSSTVEIVYSKGGDTKDVEGKY
jgi:hypothetical protein